MKIGGNSIWGEWFSGLIDEVRIYNRALSAAEIQARHERLDRVARRDGAERARDPHRDRDGDSSRSSAGALPPTTSASPGTTSTARRRAGFTPSAANRIGQPGGTTYTDTVAAGTYYYKVTAEDAAGTSAPASNEASVDRRGHGEPFGARHADRHRRDRHRCAHLGRRDRQRRRRPLQRAPLDGRRLHPRADEPDRAADGDELQRHRRAPGVYFYRVIAEDAAGNVGAADERGLGDNHDGHVRSVHARRSHGTGQPEAPSTSAGRPRPTTWA